MAKWPASFGDELEEGTLYVSPGRIENEMRYWRWRGQAFRFRKRWTTYQPITSLTYKNSDILKPESLEDFQNILTSCQAAGMPGPPTSFADPFRFMYRSPSPRLTWTAQFKFLQGGWQHVTGNPKNRGRTIEEKGPIYWYDLNSAYRWAGCRGLPDLSTARRIWRLDSGVPSLYLVRGGPAACPYWPSYGWHVLSHEELPALRQRVEFEFGIKFDDMPVDLTPTFDEIQKRFPFCYKRISRAYWGQWASRAELNRVTWKNGLSSQPMPNPVYNPVWAHFILSRVKLRFLPHLRWLLHVYVDAMLTREEVSTGELPGEWRMLGKFPSVWIDYPGHWGVARETIRHAGIASVPKALTMRPNGAIIDSRPWREV